MSASDARNSKPAVTRNERRVALSENPSALPVPAPPPTLAGMVTHNRHLAATWNLGVPGGAAVPLTRLVALRAVTAIELERVLARDWVDGALKLKCPAGNVKATLYGFSGYGNTQGRHDPTKQAAATLVFEGKSMVDNLASYLHGFATIKEAVLKHAEEWCALAE